MNLFTEETRKDTAAFAEIRNKLAHLSRPVAFEYKEIRNSVEGLGLLKRMFGGAVPHPFDRSPHVPPLDRKTARHNYLNFADLLATHFDAMAVDRGNRGSDLGDHPSGSTLP